MKKIVRVLIAILALITVSLTACGVSTSNLENTAWVLESYGKPGNLQAVLPDTEITATFASAETKVTGSAGCNNYFGGYERKGNNLSILGPIGSTMMSCGEQVDNQELQYLKALQAAESFEIRDSKLQITCGEQVLIFKRK